MKVFLKKQLGITLIEMLLVLAIASAFIGVLLSYNVQKSDQLRRDRLTLQVQQLLNAGLSYYANEGKWPKNLAALQAANYIPTPFKNLSTYGFILKNDPSTGLLYATVDVSTAHDAYLIAGSLPMAYVTDFANSHVKDNGLPVPNKECIDPTVLTCSFVVAAVNIPGQDVGNARSVNFSSLYHNGACVPAPMCPPHMKPAILVTAVSVNGANDDPQCPNDSDPTSCTNVKIYPLQSYTAYAIGDSKGEAVDLAQNSINSCSTSSPLYTECYADMTTKEKITAGKYWRVCLSVITQKGTVTIPPGTKDAVAWGSTVGSILAVTRCVPTDESGKPNEPSGSNFSVWAP